jgi:hypothetical protein
MINVDADAQSYDPADHYPPKGTEEACLAIVIDSEMFRVLGHTGRYMHGQINCAGYQGEELGLNNVPDDPGFWVMERGSVWTSFDVSAPACFSQVPA